MFEVNESSEYLNVYGIRIFFFFVFTQTELYKTLKKYITTNRYYCICMKKYYTILLTKTKKKV